MNEIFWQFLFAPLPYIKLYSCNVEKRDGPFQFRNSRSLYIYELEKNPYFWNKERIAIDGISIRNVGHRKALEMFKNQELDWLGPPFGVIRNSFQNLSEEEQFSIASKVFWFCFNTTLYPLNHIDIRRAIFLAVNRKGIMEQLKGDKKPAYSPLPEFQSQVAEEDKVLHEDPKEAYHVFCRGLKALGIAEHNFPVLKIIHLDIEAFAKVASIIKEQLEVVLGIKCTLEAVEYSSCFRRLAQRDYQIAAIRWVSWISDPIYTLDIFRDKNEKLNFTHWKSPEYQLLLDKAAKEIDPKIRKQLLGSAEKLLIKSYSILPLLYESEVVLKNPKLNVFHNHPVGIVDFSFSKFLQ